MKDFEKIIWRDALTLVDFFASWCGPCQTMIPAVDTFRKRMNGRVDVFRINVDAPEIREIVKRYNIVTLPTLMIFCRGEVLWRESGRVGYDHLVNALTTLEMREQTTH